MKMIDMLNKLESDFGLSNLVKKGVIPWSVIFYRDVYLEFDVYVRSGKSIVESVMLTSIKFGVCEKTVFRARKKMEK